MQLKDKEIYVTTQERYLLNYTCFTNVKSEAVWHGQRV